MSRLPERTQFPLWENDDGSYGCMVLLLDDDVKVELDGAAGNIEVDLSTGFSGMSEFSGTVFAAGFGHNRYETIARTYWAGLRASGSPGTLRREKAFPEVFNPSSAPQIFPGS
ncbi:MAG: hypothetical protein ACOZCF_09645 [Bacillota bacterium]